MTVPVNFCFAWTDSPLLIIQAARRVKIKATISCKAVIVDKDINLQISSLLPWGKCEHFGKRPENNIVHITFYLLVAENFKFLVSIFSSIFF